jgi:hypothetical protein
VTSGLDLDRNTWSQMWFTAGAIEGVRCAWCGWRTRCSPPEVRRLSLIWPTVGFTLMRFAMEYVEDLTTLVLLNKHDRQGPPGQIGP